MKTRYYMSLIYSIMLWSCGSENMDTSEPYRPKYHFTPDSSWMNDPNGLVYFDQEFHLFYQYHPHSTIWGPMHWGHAVSDDLINWKRLPIALYPDDLGYIFSGSAVIDYKNTTGFGSEDMPAMVAIFTHHDPKGEEAGNIDFQYQSLAYSLDKGRTWTKYSANPVLKNPGIKDFRDPKVFWYEAEQNWRMILAVKDRVYIYSSPDLKKWAFLSEFGAIIGAHGGVWECPDLFPLMLHGENETTKWVMLVSINAGGPQGGSATQYFIGDFDGVTFTPQDEETRWVDFGADNYAGVTYNDLHPLDNRRLFIGWMSNWQYARVVPTNQYRSAMTIPRELKLRKMQGKFLLLSKPTNEMSLTHWGMVEMPYSNLDSSTLYIRFTDFTKEFDVIFENDSTKERLTISLTKDSISIDRRYAGMSDFHEAFAAVHKAPLMDTTNTLIELFFDRSSVELFIDNGEVVLTDLLFPTVPYNRYTIQNGIVRGKKMAPMIETIK
ncbi:MAG: fructan beta-fructosidase [Cyclobacteriaceae bacterium]|jgi:fructan beta-fructosidase